MTGTEGQDYTHKKYYVQSGFHFVVQMTPLSAPVHLYTFLPRWTWFHDSVICITFICSLLHLNCVKCNQSHGVSLECFIPIPRCVFPVNDIEIPCRTLPQLSEISHKNWHGMHLVGAYFIVRIHVTSWISVRHFTASLPNSLREISLLQLSRALQVFHFTWRAKMKA